MSLRAPLVPNSESALIDARAEQLGCSDLMLHAAHSICAYLLKKHAGKHFLIACGPGNNGGDGYVTARLLNEAGQRVSLWPVTEAKSEQCIKELQALPASVTIINGIQDKNVSDCDIVIDAILGAGSRGPARSHIATALQQLQTLGLPCIAIDIPTGLGSKDALAHTHCITLQIGKQCLDPNKYSILDIGIPKAAYTETSSVLFRQFPRHHSAGHKGHNGKVFVLAGWQFPGARHYSSMAALKTGCDLVHCWVDKNTSIDHACVRHEHGSSDLASVIESCDVLLLGPGMSKAQHPLIDECFHIANDYQKPCVLDAEAIHHLKYKLRSAQHPPILLTPHRAELMALMGQRTFSEEAVHDFAQQDKIILAKGMVDFISDGQQWQRNPYGNPRLAVGGTGDVLAGLCAGLIARGCTLFDAARLAVYWECASADVLWQEKGPSYLPEDLLEQLPVTLKQEMLAINAWPPVSN